MGPTYQHNRHTQKITQAKRQDRQSLIQSPFRTSGQETEQLYSDNPHGATKLVHSADMDTETTPVLGNSAVRYYYESQCLHAHPGSEHANEESYADVIGIFNSEARFKF